MLQKGKLFGKYFFSYNCMKSVMILIIGMDILFDYYSLFICPHNITLVEAVHFNGCKKLKMGHFWFTEPEW